MSQSSVRPLGSGAARRWRRPDELAERVFAAVDDSLVTEQGDRGSVTRTAPVAGEHRFVMTRVVQS